MSTLRCTVMTKGQAVWAVGDLGLVAALLQFAQHRIELPGVGGVCLLDRDQSISHLEPALIRVELSRVRYGRTSCLPAPCYIPPMRSIFKSILLGLLIGTALMIAIYGLAVMGSTPAVNLLLKMTLPPFNVVAMLMDPVVPDDLERGGRVLDALLLVAWLQISVVAAVVVGGARAVLVHRSA